MSPFLLFGILIAYFALLLGVARYTARGATNESFFIGNHSSNWMVVAFGMVGTTLSGITFISVPGAVGRDAFGYLQITIGYVIGYLAITWILLPLYYRLQLTSIYRYLQVRLGREAYLSGAAFFILSRLLGATARLYLVVAILQTIILDRLGVPFWMTSAVVLAMILLYTYQGGVKTIVWTDTLQTTCMLLGLVICSLWLLDAMQLDAGAALAQMQDKGLARIFTWDGDSPSNAWKQIAAGAFITFTMTGLDQEMMQKTISVKTLADSQKNLLMMTAALVAVLLLFLFLGGLLHLYAPLAGESANGDKLFPAIVMGHMPAVVQVIFLIALISALFPSADGAITALTSSFCIDILGLQSRTDLDEAGRLRLRQRVHLGFAAAFLALVMVFKLIDSPSMISLLLKIATYTYGPLLGLFCFGMLTKRVPRAALVVPAVLSGPVLCALLDAAQSHLFAHYRVGLELLGLNGLIVFLALFLISQESQ